MTFFFSYLFFSVRMFLTYVIINTVPQMYFYILLLQPQFTALNTCRQPNLVLYSPEKQNTPRSYKQENLNIVTHFHSISILLKCGNMMFWVATFFSLLYYFWLSYLWKPKKFYHLLMFYFSVYIVLLYKCPARNSCRSVFINMFAKWKQAILVKWA